jgi:hypothetical protein
MYARVATWEGADPSRMEENLDRMRQGGPPEGLTASGALILADREKGKTLVVILFDSEEDMRKGDEVLNAMTPPVEGGMGSRTSVELYEVPLHMLRESSSL